MQSTQINKLSTPSGDQIHHLLEKIRVNFKLSENEVTRYSACKGAIAKVADALGPQAFAESAKLRDLATKINLSAVEWKDLSTYVSELLDTRYGIGYGTHFSNELMTAAQSDALIDDFMRNQFDINEDATYLLISLLFLSSETSFKEFSSLDRSELRSYSGGLNGNHSPSRAGLSGQHKNKIAGEVVDALSGHLHTYPGTQLLHGGQSYQRQGNETRDSRSVTYHERKLNRDKEDLSRDVDILLNRVPGRHSSDPETSLSSFDQRNTIVGDTSNPTVSEPNFKSIRETADVITGILSGLDVELKDIYTFGKGIANHDTAVESIIKFQEEVKPIIEALGVIPRANELAKAMPTDVKKLVAANVALNTSPQTYHKMCNDYRELVKGAGQIVEITENPPQGVKAIIGALSEVQRCEQDFTKAALRAKEDMSLDNLTAYAKTLENLYSNCEILSKLITAGGQAEEELTSFRRRVEDLSIAYGALSAPAYAWISDHPNYTEYLMGGNDPILNEIMTNSNVESFLEKQASTISSFEAGCQRFGISMHRGAEILGDQDWLMHLQLFLQTNHVGFNNLPDVLQKEVKTIYDTFYEISRISNALKSSGSLEDAKSLVTQCQKLQGSMEAFTTVYKLFAGANALTAETLDVYKAVKDASRSVDKYLGERFKAFEGELNTFTTRIDNEIQEGVQEFKTAIRNHYSWFGMVWHWFRNLF